MKTPALGAPGLKENSSALGSYDNSDPTQSSADKQEANALLEIKNSVWRLARVARGCGGRLLWSLEQDDAAEVPGSMPGRGQPCACDPCE
jgi:hypothetical protein